MLTGVRKQSWTTSYAPGLGGSVASLATRVTRRAVVILGLVSVRRTSRVTSILVHNEMVLAARAVVRSILAARAVRLARYASVVLRIWV